MKWNMKVCQDSHVGLVRKENQDNFGWFSLYDKELFIVADGMGGVVGGRTAADMAIQKIHERLTSGSTSILETLKEAINEANHSIYEKGHSGDPCCFNMGTTIIVLVVYENKAYIAHVGDSRIYLLRNGKLQRLTKDHSRVQHMVDSGLLSPDKAQLHPESHIITKCVGTQPIMEPEIRPEPIEIIPGDTFLLCTDGLCGLINDTEIEAILKERNSLESICKNMIQAALDNGGDDNVTVQVISFPEDNEFSASLKESFYLKGIFAVFTLFLIVTMTVAFFYRHKMDRHPVVSLFCTGKETLRKNALPSMQNTETTIDDSTSDKIKRNSHSKHQLIIHKKQDGRIKTTKKSEGKQNKHGKSP